MRVHNIGQLYIIITNYIRWFLILPYTKKSLLPQKHYRIATNIVQCKEILVNVLIRKLG